MNKKETIAEILKVSKLPLATLQKMSLDILKDVLAYQKEEYEKVQRLKNHGRPVHSFDHELPQGELTEFENIKALTKSGIMYIAVSLDDKHRTLSKDGLPIFSKSSGTASLCATWKYIKIQGYNLKITLTRPSTLEEREKYNLDEKVAAYKATHPKK